MEIQYQEIPLSTDSETIPSWFGNYTQKIRDEGRDLLTEVSIMEKMTPQQLNEHLGGSFEELPYEFLDTLFINGSDNELVGTILRKKREAYVKKHPEKTRGGARGGKRNYYI
ncbi:hypothetical protein AUJ42_03040 [Candidatus Collierbacteria bacterium CG1_02_44_10]|uniref:Uncharacterized protein n=3 Tax=Candidatus Collieribacteriota TaxID=1752725 RepID=A0A2H0DVP6_9BACT|nr:hypothetical protein [bacterium]OIN90443.1 MAG: hypothetical protein AUJ42_03040 [Candidatus Collierbacteria bacterium CG1_02_44_10]PIP85660.1 MAG: hypothetical protein COW83_03060 [Candidatus Collierbacteria bacterium CG22_combo_CG10-13_8_21_14_all_43_12]PIR99399.1 MAG: hypothetical protein COT86_04105 [Candidatus Collierbacteria bacterium CG10_big_fil_rev_8_21_14_0_10_43_36]